MSRHREDVARTGHVDLLDKVLVLHDVVELHDHDVGRVVDFAKEVVDLELLQASEQILNPEATRVGIVETRIRITRVVVKPVKNVGFSWAPLKLRTCTLITVVNLSKA